MPKPVFKIIPHGGSEYAAAVALRDEVLRRPLGLAFTPEDLEREKDFVHVSGFRDGVLVASCMLVPKSDMLKVQRVAVKDGLRGENIGTAMMQYCEAYALRHGFGAVFCHARQTAVPFYIKCGWLPEGELFIETTIPHLKMRKVLRAG